MNNNGNDMTMGNPLRIILTFSIPILIGNIFQQLYNVVDTAVIGHVLGDSSLAAIGSTAAICGLIIGFANGTTNGFAVVIARFYGRKDEESLKKTVALTFLLTLAISIILTAVSLIGIKSLLHFLKTPDNIMKDAAEYLKIIIEFSFITMFFNMFAGMLRAIGDSKAPLVFLIVATVVNIVLDIVFVKYLSMGIKGAAYATVIAQVVSAVLCALYIQKTCPILKIKRKNMIFDIHIINELWTTGLSMGLMYAIVSIGSVALQGAVNSFGSDTVAAHTAARKIDDIFMLPLGTLSMAASTFASQNFGAGKMHRVKKGILNSILLGMIWSVFSIIIVFTCSKPIITALTGTSNYTVLSTAVKYVKINFPFYIVLTILLVLRSSLQGVGKKIVPLTASTIELVAKFTVVGYLAPKLGYLGVCIVEPLVWFICAVIVSIDFYKFIKVSKGVTSR